MSSVSNLFFLKNKKLTTKQIIWLDFLDAHWDLSAKILDSGRDLKVNC